MPDRKPRCSARTYDPRLVDGFQCSRNGKVERDGRWYCAQHDPEAKAARQRAIEEQARADRMARQEKVDAADVVCDTLAGLLGVDVTHGGSGLDRGWPKVPTHIRIRLADAPKVIEALRTIKDQTR